MDQKEYWNKVSPTKNFSTPIQLEEFKKRVPMDAEILDVGCGYGRILNELYQEGYRKLTGADISEGMIERGRDLYPYLDLLAAAGDDLPFEDASFDAVILFAVLTGVVYEEAQRMILKEIGRVLKPGGLIYVNDFLLNEDERNRTRYEKYQEKYGIYGIFELPEGALMRHHTEEYSRSLFTDFEEEIYRKTSFITMNGNPSNGFYYFGRKKDI